MKKKIYFYRSLLIEVIETLCTICLYLERDGRRNRNPESEIMLSHFTTLKQFSTELMCKNKSRKRG